MNPDMNNNSNTNPTVVPNMAPNVNTNPVAPTQVVTPQPTVPQQVVQPGVQPVPAVSVPQQVVQPVMPVQPQAPAGISAAAAPQPVAPGTQLVQTERDTPGAPSSSLDSQAVNKAPAGPMTMQDKAKKFFNGLFNFKNILRLFKNDWTTIIEDTLPKDTKAVIDEDSYNNVFYGGILKVISDVLAIGFSVAMVYVIDTLDPAKINGLRTLGLKNDVGLTAFIPIIITLTVFLYNSSIGYQKQKTTFHFAFIWLILISTVFSTIRLVAYIATIFIAPLYALLGFFSLFLTLLGNVHVLVGCIDFCKRVNSDYKKAHTVAPVQSAITTTRIDVDDVSDHNNKTCPYCASQNPKEATTCASCGNVI